MDALRLHEQSTSFDDLVGYAHLTVGRQFEGEFDNGGLDLRVHTILEQRPAVGNLLQRSFIASIVQVLKLVEAVARVTRHATGLADVTELPGQIEYADLDTNCLLPPIHVGFLTVCGASSRYGTHPPRHHGKPTTVRFFLPDHI